MLYSRAISFCLARADLIMTNDLISAGWEIQRFIPAASPREPMIILLRRMRMGEWPLCPHHDCHELLRWRVFLFLWCWAWVSFSYLLLRRVLLTTSGVRSCIFRLAFSSC